jgi:hypothetical protein
MRRVLVGLIAVFSVSLPTNIPAQFSLCGQRSLQTVSLQQLTVDSSVDYGLTIPGGNIVGAVIVVTGAPISYRTDGASASMTNGMIASLGGGTPNSAVLTVCGSDVRRIRFISQNGSTATVTTTYYQPQL